MSRLVVNIPELGYNLEEAYKALRTNVQFCGSDVKVIAITSCVPDEGKSTVALHLAASFAEIGKRTLLIDADMRNSVLYHHLQSDEDVYGLSHYLTGQVTLKDVIYATNLPHLHLISSGYFPPNPAELLSGKRFPAMITTLREQADYIFIDVPPAAAVADSSIVTSLCDGCILVLESGRIRRRFAQDVVEQLKKTDTPLLGTILNKVKLRRNDPYYNRYYKYGYGYGYGYGRKNASSEKKKRRWFSR